MVKGMHSRLSKNLKSEIENTGHVQNLANSKKSTFFILFPWNLVKMITSRLDYFHQVSWGLDKKFGFLTDGQFLNLSRSFPSDFKHKVWNSNLDFAKHLLKIMVLLLIAISTRVQIFEDIWRISKEFHWSYKHLAFLHSLSFSLFCLFLLKAFLPNIFTLY